MKKILTLLVSLVLVAAIAVAGTLAYLSAESNEVINSFSFGGMTVTVSEPGWSGLDENNKKPVSPGSIVEKDPRAYVTTDVDAVVYLLVYDTINTENKTYVHYLDEKGNKDMNNGWTGVHREISGGGISMLYRFDTIVPAGSKSYTTGSLFDEVLIDETEVTSELLNGLSNPFDTTEPGEGRIVIEAFAHQAKADGATQDEMLQVADEAALAHFGLTASNNTW